MDLQRAVLDLIVPFERCWWVRLVLIPRLSAKSCQLDSKGIGVSTERSVLFVHK